MRRFKSRAAGLFLAAALAFSACMPCAAAAETTSAQSEAQKTEEQSGTAATQQASEGSSSYETAETEEPGLYEQDEKSEGEVSAEDAQADGGSKDGGPAEECGEPAAGSTESSAEETEDAGLSAEKAEPTEKAAGSTAEDEEPAGEPVEEAVETPAQSIAVRSKAAEAGSGTEEPDWLLGGSGNKKDISDSYKIQFTDMEAYYYEDYGLGEFVTCTYDGILNGEETVEGLICLDPKKIGIDIDRENAEHIYEYNTPMMIKAVYYGVGPANGVLRGIVEETLGTSEKTGVICSIITHISLAQIYAYLKSADPSMGSVKSSVGDGFYYTSPVVKELVNKFGNAIEDLPVPDNYFIYVIPLDNPDVQDFAFGSYRLPGTSARMKLKKSSAVSLPLEDNACYSMTGAEYGVYTDAGCTEEAGVLTTDEEGNTEELVIGPGTVYYVREKKAPAGYLVDETVYEAGPAEPDEVISVSVSDVPGVSEADLRIIKKSRKEGEQTENSSLQDTEFTVSYYDGFYDAETLPEEAKRKWVIRALDSDEGCIAQLTEEHLVSGTLYTVDQKAVIPLGTITVRETKAAPGYINDGDFGGGSDVYIGQIRISENGTGTEFVTVQGKPDHEDGSKISFTVLDTPKEEKKNPEIGTTAVNSETGTHTARPGGTVTIEDTVNYADFEGGKEYTMSGRLIDRSTGETLIDAGGSAVTASVRFTADVSGSGSVVVPFTFDTDASMEGKSFVVFEIAAEAETGSEIAFHEDADDEGQTVRFPYLRTSVKDKSDGDNTIKDKGAVKLKDTVEYRNLTPGLSYRIEGVLVSQKTGNPARDGGKEITGSAETVPDTAEGSCPVTFEFEAGNLEKGEYVVFEDLYEINPGTGEETLVASHRDPGDRSQTVYHPVSKESPGNSDTTGTGDSNSPGSLIACMILSAFFIAGAVQLRNRSRKM